MRFLLPLLLGCAAFGASAAPSIALQSGVPVRFNLPANSFTTSYYIDVTDADQSLRIDLDSPTAGVDVDLMLRHGTPFPDSHGGNRPVSADYVGELAHYRSISGGNDEYVVFGRTGGQPLRAGRWYLFLINYNTAQGTAIDADSTVTATLSSTDTPAAAFTVNFNSSGTAADPCSNTEWFDTTPATPGGGNPGTTLGEQRRNAMLRAAEDLAAQMKSPVPIAIDACAAQFEIQKLHATRKATVGPNSCSIFACMPWPPRRESRAIP